MALLGQMQSLLAALYDAPVEYDVHDYLITDPAHAAALQESPSPPGTDEQLLIAATDDGMELGLYLDAAVLERLGRRCPLVALDESNLGDFCTALEGVSHFHYVTWSTGCDRSVSLLELELQAEVDKYASALSLLLQQREGRFPGELFQRLFASCRLLPHGSPPLCGAILRAAGDEIPAQAPGPPRRVARGVAVVLSAGEPRQAAARAALCVSEANPGLHSVGSSGPSVLRFVSIHFESSRRSTFFIRAVLPSDPLS
jgi:hypothetical protein